MANLKAGTLIGGNLIWNAGNLPIRVEPDKLYFNNSAVYTEANKPTPAAIGAVNKAGDTMTGNLMITHNNDVHLQLNAGVNKDSTLYLTEDSKNHGMYIRYGGASSDNKTVFGTRQSNVEKAFMEVVRFGGVNFPITPTASSAPTASGHLTRKDYVDSQDEKRALKAGDTFTGRVVLGYTSSVKVPTGTTAQRGTGAQGDFRFNTDETGFEGFDGSEWQPVGSRIKYTTVNKATTLVKGKGYLVDTNVSGIVITLPADAKDSDYVIVGDGSAKASVNPFFVAGYNGDRVKVDRDNCFLRFNKVGTKWVISGGVGEGGGLKPLEYIKSNNGRATGRLSVDSNGGSLAYSGTNVGDVVKGIDYLNDDNSLAGTFGMRWNGISKTLDSFVAGRTSTDTWMRVKASGVLYANGDNRIYHQGFKPTAADVGVYTKSEIDLMTQSTRTIQRPSGAVDGKYYPIVINNYDSDQHVFIETRSSGGSDPMNCCSFDGIVRSAGWSDKTSVIDGTFTIYHANERAIHSILWPTESSGGCAIYVEARAFPVYVRIRGSATVNCTGQDITFGTSKFLAGVDDPVSVAVAANKVSVGADFSKGTGRYLGNNKFYNEGFKPTASDVGLPLVPNTKHTAAAEANTVPLRDGSGDVHCRLVRTTYADESGFGGGVVFRRNNGNDNYLRVCNNPENIRSWLGAVSKGGDTMTGTLGIPRLEVRGVSSHINLIETDQTNKEWRLEGTNGNFAITESGVATRAVFKAGGGVDFSGVVKSSSFDATGTGNVISTIGGKIRSNANNIMSMDGNTYSFVTSTADAHLCYNSYWDGEWKKYSTASDSGYVVVRAGNGLEYVYSPAGQTNPNHSRFPILHTGNVRPINLTDILTPVNGWSINNAECVVYEYPTHYHVTAILRHSNGVAHIGNWKRGVKYTYSPCLMSNQTYSYVELQNTGSGTFSCTAAAGKVWIMVNMLVQKV